MIEPSHFVSLPPSTFNEGGYWVRHSTAHCVSSNEMIDNRNVPIITCPSEGGLLLDQVTQPDISNAVTREAIQSFNTWVERASMLSEAFITLQFLNETTVSRATVYCLVLQDLKVREPKKFRLFSSTVDSIYPTTKITGIDDSVFTVISSGTTTIRRINGDDDDDDDDDGINNINAAYEYRKYDLEIPADRQTTLNFLRISMDFEGDNWIFISETEVYHIENPGK